MLRPKGILFDLDGVIYNGETPIAGAAQAVDWARSTGIPFLFLTNTTSRPRSAIVEKLDAMGVAASIDDIWTPPAAAAQWLAAERRSPVALFVPERTREDFAGVDCLDESTDVGAQAVVVGDLGEKWDFATLNRAFRLLHADPECALVALGMTRYWSSANGPCLDVAPFVAALECAASREAVVLGKPAEVFFEAAADKLNVEPSDLLMIGDDIRTDVGGAQSAGLAGALVKTGKYRPADLSEALHPDALFDSVADLPSWWEGLD